jgi:hypothetical protein
MVERPTVIMIGDPRASRVLGSSLAEVAQVIYLEDRGVDLAGFCAALEIEQPLVLALGGDDESLDRLRAGRPALLIRPGDPDAAGAARRFVQSFQPGE